MSVGDFANWVTIIALPLTIWGLGMTYRQGRKIKSSAEAAETSALAMAKKIDSMVAIEKNAQIIEKLNNCDELLHNDNWKEVISHLRNAKVQLITVQKNGSYSTVHDSDFRISCNNLQLDIDTLRSIQNGDNFEPDKTLINKHIDRAIEILTLVHAEIKNEYRNGKNQ